MQKRIKGRRFRTRVKEPWIYAPSLSFSGTYMALLVHFLKYSDIRFSSQAQEIYYKLEGKPLRIYWVHILNSIKGSVKKGAV